MQLYFYRAYGLRIQSNSIIPGFNIDRMPSPQRDVLLDIGDNPPPWFLDEKPFDSVIRFNQLTASEVSDLAYTIRVWGPEEFFELTYTDGARFIIDGEANRIWCQKGPLAIEDVSVYLRGPIMGFVLRRRGVLSLHASAVSMFGQSVVLCGPSESGKSTTAAALALRGTPVICDDITALAESEGSFYVQPGYPRICLWPDIAQPLLGEESDGLPRITSTWEKCFLPLDGSKAKFQEERQPLGIVYILGSRVSEGRAPWIEEVSPREAFLALVQNTYMNWFLDRRRRAAEFNVLSRLVMQVPVRRIVPHKDPRQIKALCELITLDAHQVLSTAVCAKDSAAQD